MTRRTATSLVFALAALASIATSPPPEWVLTASLPLPATTLVGANTAYAITTEWRGPVDEIYGGTITVDLELALANPPQDVTTTDVRITLADEDDPASSKEYVARVDSAGKITTTIDYFGAVCTGTPCFVDYRLTIAHYDAGDTTQVALTGSVTAELRGDDAQQHPEHDILVEVTPLGTVP